MTLSARWNDSTDFTPAAENLVESTINSLMVCTTSDATTLTLDPSVAAYAYTGDAAGSWTLPTVAGNTNRRCLIYNRGSAALTINTASGGTIYSIGTSIVLPPNTYARFLNDGTYWLLLSKSRPQFDAVGAGFAGQATGATSETHVIAAGASILLWVTYSYLSAPTISATVGSTAMTLLSNQTYATVTGNTAGIACYGLLAPPSGSQSVTFNCSTANDVVMNSVSYLNAVRFGTPTFTTGTGSGASQLVASDSGHMASQAFAFAGSGSISSYSQTSRYNESSGRRNGPAIIGDAIGSPSLNFTASLGSSAPWMGMAVNIT